MIPLAIAQIDIYTLAETKIFFRKLGKTVGKVCFFPLLKMFTHNLHIAKRVFLVTFFTVNLYLFCSHSKSHKSLLTSMTELFLEEIGNSLKLLTIYVKEIQIYSAGIYLSMRSIWCLYC